MFQVVDFRFPDNNILQGSVVMHLMHY